MNEYIKETYFFSDKTFTDIVPISTGYHVTLPGYKAYGNRPYHMIHYVEDGCGEVVMGGETYSVKKGQIFIIPKGQPAVYTADEQTPWKYSWVNFVGTYADRLAGISTPVADGFLFPFSKIKNLEHFTNAKEELVISLLYQVFAEISINKIIDHDYVTQTENMIKSLYMTGITVSEIAVEIGLDRRYLSRIFSESKGVSIKQYITDIRMQAAKFFLLEGKSVSLVAELVGYNDQFNFSKMFKKHIGVSPSHIRRIFD